MHVGIIGGLDKICFVNHAHWLGLLLLDLVKLKAQNNQNKSLHALKFAPFYV